MEDITVKEGYKNHISLLEKRLKDAIDLLTKYADDEPEVREFRDDIKPSEVGNMKVSSDSWRPGN